MSEVESLINIPVEHCSNIFGQFDEYAKVIEKTLKVTIIVRDSSVKVIGAEAAVQRASGVLNYLYELSKSKDPLDAREVLTDVGLQDRMLIIPLHSHLKKRLIC